MKIIELKSIYFEADGRTDSRLRGYVVWQKGQNVNKRSNDRSDATGTHHPKAYVAGYEKTADNYINRVPSGGSLVGAAIRQINRATFDKTPSGRSKAEELKIYIF